MFPILPPHFLPLALPRFRISESGCILSENYNGKEFVHCSIIAKKKETSRVRITSQSSSVSQLGSIFKITKHENTTKQTEKKPKTPEKNTPPPPQNNNTPPTKHGSVSCLKPTHNGVCFTTV